MYEVNDGVAVFYWNPHRYRRLSRAGIKLGPRMRNFGDMLGPEVVRAMRPAQTRTRQTTSPRRHPVLQSVGSVMHFAHDDATVWGTGVNGKVLPDEHVFRHLDVRSVRGPLTRDWLHREKGIDAPAVFGDPALLLHESLRALGSREPERRVLTIPNLNDLRALRGTSRLASPRRPYQLIARDILASEFVITSSLHALIFAELLEVPVALVLPRSENLFKYEDYFQGTNRSLPVVHDTWEDAQRAVATGAQGESLHAAWQPAALRGSFPHDLWVGTASRKGH